MKGTPKTMAPEMLLAIHKNMKIIYSSKIDLWAIGIIYYFMLTGKYLFGFGNCEMIIEKIFKTEKLKESINKLSKISSLSKDLLQKLLAIQPQYRINWKSFFIHPIFQTNSLYQSSKMIRSSIFGIELLVQIGANELFLKNKSNFKLGHLQEPKDRELDFEKSGLQNGFSPSNLKRSHITDSKRTIPFDFSRLKQLKKNIMGVKVVLNHEMNKYVFASKVLSISKKYFRDKKYINIRENLLQYFKLIVWEKANRVRSIANGLEKKQMVIQITEKQISEDFLKSPLRMEYFKYFKNLENFLIELLKSFKIASKSSKSNRINTRKVSELKKIQKKLYLEILKTPVCETIQIDTLEQKIYLLFQYKLGLLARLNYYFKFKDPKTKSPFNWVLFFDNLTLIKSSKLQKMIFEMKEEFKNEINRKIL